MAARLLPRRKTPNMPMAPQATQHHPRGVGERLGQLAQSRRQRERQRLWPRLPIQPQPQSRDRRLSSRASTSASAWPPLRQRHPGVRRLGGFVHSDLDYDAVNRLFNFEGGQVGGYATYLRGGLFVDTLVNVHLMQIDTRTLGFPNSMNATTVGVRTDSGYRFGSFHGGAFIEPLATISVTWADIDGFTHGGNKVSFNDDANVQGPLRLRVGTTTPLWTGLTAEPFVIGSLWGNLSDNKATLVSTGTTFQLEDKLQDVWGEVSAGVNFFNPSANTSVFAKVDVTFGDNIDGVGGKAGMRVSW